MIGGHLLEFITTNANFLGIEILKIADISNLPYTGRSEIVAILRNLRSIEYIYRSFYLEDHL